MIELTNITLNPIPLEVELLTKSNQELKGNLTTASWFILLSCIALVSCCIMQNNKIKEIKNEKQNRLR